MKAIRLVFGYTYGCKFMGLAIAFVLMLPISFCSPRSSDPPALPLDPHFYTAGNTSDVSPATVPGLALVGGGGRCNEAYRWLIQRSGGGDFVFLTTTDYSDQDDNQFFVDMRQLGAVDSITTLTVNSRAMAEAEKVETAVRNAELLFIDGGDQTEYYDLWKGTRLQNAVRYLLETKKIPLGGTSAGMAVLSGLAYIPLKQGVTSAEALGDPFHANMDSIKNDFLTTPFLVNTISDTHWSERDRCGRTIAFQARIITDGLTSLQSARAIACDERTAVCIDSSGWAVVFGNSDADDFAFFLSCRSMPERCLPGQSLHWTNAVSIWKVKGTEAGINGFDLLNWQGHDGSRHDVNVLNGVLSIDIQTPE
jgi:cyanophycinase-like exopeptidase